MVFLFFVIGATLGILIGALGMWLHLMQKNAGRPIDWRMIGMSFFLTTAIGGIIIAALAHS